MIIAVKFSNLSNWKEEAWKNQGFNGIRTRDLRDTGAMLYQLSYEATHICVNLTAMIILHFHLQPQFIYELFHINSTSCSILIRIREKNLIISFLPCVWTFFRWIYGRSYIWTAEKEWIYDWSSQLHTQLKQFFSVHISNISTKAGQRVEVIMRSRNLIPTKANWHLYKTSIRPHLILPI